MVSLAASQQTAHGIEGSHVSISAEQCVIACCLLYPQHIPEIDLTPEDFEAAELRSMWSAMQSLATSGAAVDAVSVARASELDATLVADIATAYVQPRNLEHYVAAVREDSLTRNVQDRCLSLASSGLTGQELLHECLRSLGSIRMSGVSAGRILRDGLCQTLDAMERAYFQRGGAVRGVSTGLNSLDRCLGGLPPGVLTVVAARPSVGKSSLVAMFAYAAAMSGVAVDWYSLEDTESAIHRRILARITKQTSQTLISGVMPENEWLDVSAGVRSLAESAAGSNILICDSLPYRASQVISAMRRNAAKRNTGLIILDYLQLCREPGASKSGRHDEIAIISQQLKGVAKDTNAALVVVSQLNRFEGDTPQLHHLRDSGAIEQDAHVVLLLHRQNLEDAEGQLSLVQCDIAKNKDGCTSAVHLQWDGRYYEFSDLDDSARNRLLRSGKAGGWL